MRAKRSAAAPEASARSTGPRPRRGRAARRPRTSISRASALVTACSRASRRRAGQEVDASRTSSAFPTSWPSDLVHVGEPRDRPEARFAGHRRPGFRPAPARSRGTPQKAPEPTFTSMTSASSPAASFFERIDAVMSGTESTVAVTSRSRRAAGPRARAPPSGRRSRSRPRARLPGTGRGPARRRSRGCSRACRACRPCDPSPWPEIIGTKPPQAATSGARIRLTVSPTPPVECLSRTGPSSPAPDQSRTVPERPWLA